MEFGSRKKLVKTLVGYLNEITGPKAKFILILCASSGMVEKATNPERMWRQDNPVKIRSIHTIFLLIKVGVLLSDSARIVGLQPSRLLSY